jgi:serine/threonine protein kinase
VAFLTGRETFMEMEQNVYVGGSLGMFLYEFTSGKHYFEDKQDCKVQLLQQPTLKNTEEVNLDNEQEIDSQLKDSIQYCLTI